MLWGLPGLISRALASYLFTEHIGGLGIPFCLSSQAIHSQSLEHSLRPTCTRQVGTAEYEEKLSLKTPQP